MVGGLQHRLALNGPAFRISAFHLRQGAIKSVGHSPEGGARLSPAAARPNRGDERIPAVPELT